MANPIIKIKRGSGEPPVWDGSIGITAGEFAFDRTTGMLYLGVTGQYLAQNYPGLCALNGPFVIPLGAQISDDQNFGSGGDANNLGNSSYTIPTTRAVREYVLQQKANALLGLTFSAGPGIELEYPGPSAIQINNTGVIQGFGSLSFQAQNGGVFSGTPSSVAGSTQDVIKFLPQSGIAMTNNVTTVNGVSTNSINILNIGVTGINGKTGNITNFDSIGSLSGSTAFINGIAKESFYFAALGPILSSELAEIPAPGLPGVTQTVYQLSHANPLTSVQSGDFGINVQSADGYLYIPSITFDVWGHAKFAKGITLFGGGFIPAGLTEAVQDIVGDSSFFLVGSGLSRNYNDPAGTFTLTNTGVTAVQVGSNRLNGTVTFEPASASGISVTNNGNTVNIGQNIPKYKDINLSGNISNQIQLQPSSSTDVLGIRAGVGIGFTAFNGGGQQDDSFTINNQGVVSIKEQNGTGITGDIVLVEGTGVEITVNGNTKEITISAAGGGDGNIGSINGQYYLDGQDSAQGVTGFVKISGISYGDGAPTSFNDYGRNIVTYRSDEDTNGTIFVDLSSNVKIPADGSNLASITIPNKNATRITGTFGVLGSANQITISENNLVVPLITAGGTGAGYYVENNGTRQIDTDIVPGKELIITAAAGSLPAGQGGGVSPSDWNASIVVSAYPTNQNFRSLLEALGDGSFTIGECPDYCIGPPPLIGSCNGAPYDGPTRLDKGHITVIGNQFVDGALAVNADIFLKGDIYGSDGCKLDIGAASQASDYFDACGTLRNPGGVYVNGADCNDKAIFNVSEFFIKDRLVTIGGASGNNAPTLQSAGQFGTTMDVGFLMPSWLDGQARTAFIGIDTSVGTEGTFKFIPTASLTENENGRFVTGNVGPAEFATINGIGISGGNSTTIVTSGNGNSTSNNRLVIRDRNTSGTADISIKGQGNLTFAGSNNITLDSGARILLGGSNIFKQSIAGNGVLEFSSALRGLTFTQSTDVFQILRRRNDNLATVTYEFPSISSGTMTIVDTTSTQELTDKTLGEDCVIDCGSY